jgi:hypothetical protein
MMANRHPKANPTTTSPDDTDLAPLLSDVETCVHQAKALRNALSPLHCRHLDGEPVQEELNDVFDRHEALRRLARWEAVGELEEDLDQAVDADELDEETRQDFADLWQAIDWIVPGYVAFERERTKGVRDWTNAGLDSEMIDGEVIIKHTFQWGLDEVHSIRAPAEKMFNENVKRLGAIVTHLCQAVEQGGDVSPETIATLCDDRDDLEQLLEVLTNLEAVVDQAADEAESTTGDTTERGPSTEPDNLASLIGSSSDETDNEDDDGDPEASIGFH